MEVRRYRVIGDLLSLLLSTRFGIAVWPNTVAGKAIEPPTSPVWTIDMRFSDGARPSPVLRNSCVNDHESADWKSVAVATAVVTFVRRLRVKKDGVKVEHCSNFHPPFDRKSTR